jgi:hypothetical protein
VREMGCESFMREQDAEIAGRWIMKVEKTMIQISIPEGLRVNCATQLLSDRAMTWWETVQLRRATETLTWSVMPHTFICVYSYFPTIWYIKLWVIVFFPILI